MQHKGIRIALAVIEVFIGVGAIYGGTAILTGAFDQWLAGDWLRGTPFTGYTIPGLTLAMVIGGGMLLSAATIFARREWAVLLSATMGLMMVCFEVVEAVSVDGDLGNFLLFVVGMQLLYFVLGLLIFGLAGYLWMTEYRGHSLLSRHVSHA